MIKSMTGYGKAVCELPKKSITIEVKSLNSKQADVYLRLPNLYREKESDIRNIVINTAKRGKIECTIIVDNSEGEQAASINLPVVKQYYSQVLEIQKELNIENNEPLLQTILRLPDALKTEKEEIDEAEWKALTATLNEALSKLDDFRLQEGKSLKSDILERIKAIELLQSQIGDFEIARTERIKDRLKNNLNEFFTADMYDKNRYEQELIYYLEKLDITEEKVRLKNHCEYFRQVATEDEQAGKKLGFLCQEIGREINTLGAKANDFEIQKIVILMKDELEKIKEQLMNVL
ncbi:MAG: YicC family protein [Bacteroidales bacterium]|nr:YicC family protein [Bacteroidales bacterium]